MLGSLAILQSGSACIKGPVSVGVVVPRSASGRDEESADEEEREEDPAHPRKGDDDW
jgi:hypothetical protein